MTHHEPTGIIHPHHKPQAPHGYSNNQVVWDGSVETWTINGEEEFNPDQFETLYWDGNSWGSMLGSIGSIGSKIGSAAASAGSALGSAAKTATGALETAGKLTSGPLGDLAKTATGAMGDVSKMGDWGKTAADLWAKAPSAEQVKGWADTG